jgi:DegV family protein with EDD domain
MIAVVTDSCASIPPELVESLQIEVVPYYLHKGRETLRDGVDISPTEFFRWLATADKLPTTANPGPGDYLTAFERAARRAEGIVSVHMTSKGSGAYQSACVAQEMARTQLPAVKIEVVDTLQTAMVHGWAAIESARVALAGAGLEQVVATARRVSDTGCMIQVADTLRFLYMGGRIGRAQNLMGTLLNVKPIIGMDEGIIVPFGQARSTSKAYLKILDLMRQRGAAASPIKVGITHVDAPKRADLLAGLVKHAFDCRETWISELSPALGVHAGPGTVGVNFFPLESGADT